MLVQPVAHIIMWVNVTVANIWVIVTIVNMWVNVMVYLEYNSFVSSHETNIGSTYHMRQLCSIICRKGETTENNIVF